MQPFIYLAPTVLPGIRGIVSSVIYSVYRYHFRIWHEVVAPDLKKTQTMSSNKTCFAYLGVSFTLRVQILFPNRSKISTVILMGAQQNAFCGL